MFLRTAIAAFALVASACSTVQANVWGQLRAPSVCTYGFQSQTLEDGFNMAVFRGPRAADDFVAGATSKLRYVTVGMIGRGTAGVLPARSTFGLQFFTNDANGTNKPGAVLFSAIVATRVVDRGPAQGSFFGPGFRYYEVTFEFPAATSNIWLQSGKRYWVCAHGRCDNSNWWYFAAHNSGGAIGNPCHTAPQYGTPGWRWYSIGNFTHNKLSMQIGY